MPTTSTHETSTHEQGSSTMDQRKRRDGFFSDPGAIAPSVDKSWRDDFIVELRLLDVPGDRIGDALVTVESHVVESGESAQESFGDARAYARELAPPAKGGSAWPGLSPLFLVGNLLGLLGLLITSRAFSGWLEGGPVGIVAGDLVSPVVLLGVMGLVITFFDRFARVVMDHTWWGFAISFVALGLLVALPALLLRQHLFDVSAGALALVGLGLLVVSSVLSYREAAADVDEIVAPGERPRGPGRSAGLAAALVLPLATLAVLLITWVPTIFA